MNKKGFSLIELMIAIAITVIIIITIVPWGAASIVRYYQWYQIIDHAIELDLTRNLILHDIFNGSYYVDMWNCDNAHKLIGKQHDGSWFCWMIRKGTVVRITGTRAHLIQKAENLRAIPLVHNVRSFSCEMTNLDDRVHHIRIKIETKNNNYSLKGVPRHAYR